jgi:hypothetical protein
MDARTGLLDREVSKILFANCFGCYFFHTCPILEIQMPKLIRKMRRIQMCGEKSEMKSTSKK